MDLGTLRRKEIIAPLRNGTVPRRGLEHLAVGLGRFEAAIDEELEHVAHGYGAFKAVRGEYGSGKTFFSRWVQHRAQQRGFATAEVQISASETPLHKLETIYRRALESLRTKEWDSGAFRALVDRWFYGLEEEVNTRGGPREPAALAEEVGDLLETRLTAVRDTQPLFATVLRACYRARVGEDNATADGLLAWLMGQPNVGASVKRPAGLQGDIDGTAAAGFLRGLLVLLRETGRKGLLLVLDEVETIQRMRADVREQSLDALRKLIDDIDGERYPGLYVMITGTPAFFEGPQGIKRLAPLEQRLYQDFSGDPRFDSARATQIRLLPFDVEKLVEVGGKVRALYPTKHPQRIAERVGDAVVRELAAALTGKLGGRVGVAPRLFLRKMVSDLLDKVDEHEEYDPRRDFKLVVDAREMTSAEREAAGLETTVDDIALDLPSQDGGERRSE
ncbi:ATP-binding protein [Sorangium cellulosum]|uniref:ATP-binding protein n=1 Tax=Sorangium cellulosum TaxID=56 RepID=A0A2L0ESL2_SORCE|nr:BREX system ATP-binding protein BrxD [Sorangium cellulosum]AUX42279.1 ATP-binding protein [Sorangium cellulosum]